ncbi:sigma-70 family RNA polymerase sigma factor [Blastopirellula sp. JC732]|uniref:Sigma-70 family RNA polymerase sigma factor n=1 Tax=Blastopirellula sediminis TaxID=2894196 RepID=A0A9X1SGM9_9BACT|nr:sigma-70 family RNA polymerase sigma factor [Blastopirellula sediminis]MCC9608367.1 sigma-70 family RNA polymerase sigma factor [Blastopirellula sediminis]MCC9628856.1 sigma-70 family RNA polymerase sigma factor [Blastopirellula sediminis]
MPNSKINFVPNDDFESTTEMDFEAIDIELYAAEDRPLPRDPKLAAESFLCAVEQSRLLTFEGEQFLFKRLNFLRFRASALQSTLKNRRNTKKTDAEIDRLLSDANQTREEIAHANLRLATSISQKHAQSRDEFEEFLAESNAILLNAIDKFDYARGYRFSTYATHAIQRNLFRLIEKRNKRRKLESAEEAAIQTAASPAVDPDRPTDVEVQNAFDAIMSRIDDALDPREQFIVRQRFGLDQLGKGKSLREIGDELGISKERTRQLYQRSIEKLAEVAKPFEALFAST